MSAEQDLLNSMREFLKANVKNPIFKVKMTFFRPEDPRCAEHDDLMPVDGMIFVPICKDENSEAQSIKAFGCGLGDGPNGPHVACDTMNAVHALAYQAAHLDDCPVCKTVLACISNIISKAKEDPSFIDLLTMVASEHVAMAAGPVGVTPPDEVLKLLGIDPERLKFHKPKESTN